MRPKSPEHRAKISAALRGKVLSAETRAKISAKLKGQHPSNRGKKLSPLSEEHKAKLSAALRGRRYKTHCKRGHELAGDNVMIDKRGKRTGCRECKTDYFKQYRKSPGYSAIRKRHFDKYISQKDSRGECRRCSKPVAPASTNRVSRYCVDHLEIRLADTRARMYGASPVIVSDLLAAQDGVCAICKTPPDEDGRNLNLDHNHTTKVIRGMLCRRCNSGVGQFRDNPSLLLTAYQYVLSSGVMR